MFSCLHYIGDEDGEATASGTVTAIPMPVSAFCRLDVFLCGARHVAALRGRNVLLFQSQGHHG